MIMCVRVIIAKRSSLPYPHFAISIHGYDNNDESLIVVIHVHVRGYTHWWIPCSGHHWQLTSNIIGFTKGLLLMTASKARMLTDQSL